MSQNAVESTSLSIVQLYARAYSITLAPNTATKMNQPQLSANTLTNAGKVATFTTLAAHHLRTGMRVKITGAADEAYNGRFTITVTSTTAFTYNMETEPAGAAGGAPKADVKTMAQNATIFAASGNAAAITIGPDSNADAISIAANGERKLEAPTAAKFDLEDWYAKSTSAGTFTVVLF